MKLTPRPYQVEAHDRVVESWKKSTDPVVVSAATGSGKSIIVAMLAKTLHGLSGGKRVLCLAPSKELTLQNHEKYLAIGEKASIYSASISKSLRHQVIFATPLSFKKVAKRLGREFAGVIIDECHGITPSIKDIISDMKESSPTLRVCGLSATPYRMTTGYIYAVDSDDKALDESLTRDPYFKKCVYEISARYLVEQGFLTPLIAGDINSEKYATDGLIIKRNGQFDADSVRQAFEGHGRKTSRIVADIVAQTQNSTGVMIFAATIAHAKEVMSSLHPDNARLVTGETGQGEREKILEDFKAQKFTYLVNVAVLTTGFDAPNVSHVAILRATESVSLLVQIMGRGMRLFEGKKEAVILDYAGNIEKHMPDGDLYEPDVKTAYQGGGGDFIEAVCEECDRVNIFSARPNDENYDIDKHGYFVDLSGHQLMVEKLDGSESPMPAHFGRRCQHTYMRTGDKCDYYWTCKMCPICEHANDIAARFCSQCKTELVNPNEKLIDLHTKHKKDPTQWQCDELLELEYFNGLSRAGNDMITVNITTPRRKFTIYLLEHNDFVARKKTAFMLATDELKTKPRTITYRKHKEFWEVAGFGAPTDEELLKEKLG